MLRQNKAAAKKTQESKPRLAMMEPMEGRVLMAGDRGWIEVMQNQFADRERLELTAVVETTTASKQIGQSIPVGTTYVDE